MSELRVLTVKQAAEYLQLSEDVIYNLSHRADFPAVRIGRKILIDRLGLDEWFSCHLGKAVDL